jgi:predicted dehydrogenase
MASAPLRILVAGAGLFGREHLDRLVTRDDVRVVGVADPGAAARDQVRSRYRIDAVFADPLEMLDRVPADGVIVATPSASHVPITLRAIARGVAVLLEKPVAPSADLALQLMRAAADAGVLVLPGHVMRFARDHQRLADIVSAGGIGTPLYVNSRRYRDDTHAVRYGDVDPVLMTMIHDIDLALWITESTVRSAHAWRNPGGSPRSVTAASCVMESGAVCDLRTAWTFTDGELPPDRLEVVGDRGSIELELDRSFLHFAAGRRQQLDLAADDDALTNEQGHFMTCLRDRSLKPALTLRDAAAGLRLAEAVMQSLAINH